MHFEIWIFVAIKPWVSALAAGTKNCNINNTEVAFAVDSANVKQ